MSIIITVRYNYNYEVHSDFIHWLIQFLKPDLDILGSFDLGILYKCICILSDYIVTE